ncbi:toll/interleukin-1 receptor domain-containing protein [Granulicella sp. S190]|uniref:toll/interleukin-1 receptor domain-containing protein n=1 Tax=Granulicella sp. S190 TaxID=1747226 RepID=UPI001C204AE8|nr:toll/interleukin-1 receptor domain-containing protein [Granulicella sp. S190]
MNEREAIFISHATPEDNDLTIWLGAKLSAMGYEVWADVLRLRGGHDWQRRLEAALRNRACKVLLIANPISVEKQGVRNEIQIASDVARGLKDDSFVIPLRTKPYQSPFLIAQAQYINFERGWAEGFQDLILALNDYGVPHNQPVNTDVWRELQTIHARALTTAPETLVSNWVSVQNLPPRIFFHPEGSDLRAFDDYVRVPYGNGHLSFAGVLPKRGKQNSRVRRTDALINEGWNALGLPKHEGRKLITQLINAAVADYLKRRGLSTYMMANRHEAFWMSKTTPLIKVQFDWKPYRGSRLLQGKSLKRGVQWHFAVSPSYQVFPSRHICFRSRLIFTTDGESPIQSSGRMHQLRRSFAKGWRNARWRDMLLAFLYWLSQGSNALSIPVSPDESIELRLPPMFFRSPVGLPAADESQEPDEDDPTPDLEEERFDELPEEEDF